MRIAILFSVFIHTLLAVGFYGTAAYKSKNTAVLRPIPFAQKPVPMIFYSQATKDNISPKMHLTQKNNNHSKINRNKNLKQQVKIPAKNLVNQTILPNKNTNFPVFAPFPEYPKQAKKRKIHADINVKIFVTAQGHVERILIGEHPKNKFFYQAIIDTLKNWRFNSGKQRFIHECTLRFILVK